MWLYMKQIVRRRVYITLSILLRLCAQGHDTSTGICPISQNFESIKGHEYYSNLKLKVFCAKIKGVLYYYVIPTAKSESIALSNYHHQSDLHHQHLKQIIFNVLTVFVLSS